MLEVPDSVPASPSIAVPPLLIPVSPDNLASDLRGESDPLEFDLDPPRSETNPLVSESKPLSIGVIYELEPEAEKEMAADLTANFRARMHKQLHEPIDVVAPSTKKPRQEAHDQPIKEMPSTPAPHPDTVGCSSVPPAVSYIREEPRSAPDQTQADPAPAPEEKYQKDAPPYADPPTWEEMKKMLE